VLRPAGRAARAAGRTAREMLDAARRTARQTRADIRRALLGDPGPTARKEPVTAGTRTLESRTGREASPQPRG
ncbi:hypothetical protein G3I51_22125, partial [Streptomyces sp. SID9944]|nr:hypothetical protein [Streptomyces sp. SID9944]